VLRAKFWQEALTESEKRKDERALQILQTVFPEKKLFS